MGWQNRKLRYIFWYRLKAQFISFLSSSTGRDIECVGFSFIKYSTGTILSRFKSFGLAKKKKKKMFCSEQMLKKKNKIFLFLSRRQDKEEINLSDLKTIGAFIPKGICGWKKRRSKRERRGWANVVEVGGVGWWWCWWFI